MQLVAWWEVLLGRHRAYNTSNKRCSLCLNEKLKIALNRNNNMLNRRTKNKDKKQVSTDII